jgi:F-type H+-transporting ATPase subunit b
MNARALARTVAAALLVALAALLAVPAVAAAAEPSAPEAANNVFAGDIGNAIWTVLIFLLVLVVLGKYAWGPLLKGMQAREAFIREALETAHRDREQAEQRLREYQDKLAAARAEATAIIEEGRRDAEAVKRRIEEQAKHESDKMVERAKREIASATAEATRQLYTLSASLATDLASRIIGRELDPKDHERLIANSIADLEARRN